MGTEADDSVTIAEETIAIQQKVGPFLLLSTVEKGRVENA